MAKNKQKMKQTEKKIADTFKDISNGDWSIILNTKTRRKELQNNGKLVFSDISSQICKNIAYTEYGVDDNWKLL